MEFIQMTVRKCHVVQPKRDFLKWYRVVKHWAKVKYGLTEPDLEMLYFLRSEHLFSVKDFERYNNIFPWDSTRFKRLKKDGWIDKWRTEGMDKNRWAMYRVSKKGQRTIDSIYKKLNGEEDFSMNLYKNPTLKRERFVDKTISMAMKEMNAESQKERLTRVHGRRDGKR